MKTFLTRIPEIVCSHAMWILKSCILETEKPHENAAFMNHKTRTP